MKIETFLLLILHELYTKLKNVCIYPFYNNILNTLLKMLYLRGLIFHYTLHLSNHFALLIHKSKSFKLKKKIY